MRYKSDKIHNSFAFYFVSQHYNHERPGAGYTELLLPRLFKTFTRSQLHTNLFLYDMKILSNKKLKLLLKFLLHVQTSRLSMQIQSIERKWDDNISYTDVLMMRNVKWNQWKNGKKTWVRPKTLQYIFSSLKIKSQHTAAHFKNKLDSFTQVSALGLTFDFGHKNFSRCNNYLLEMSRSYLTPKTKENHFRHIKK